MTEKYNIDSEYTNENSQFNKGILHDIRNSHSKSIGFNKLVVNYAKYNRLSTLLAVALDNLNVPTELSLEERIVYYDLFVKGKTADVIE